MAIEATAQVSQAGIEPNTAFALTKGGVYLQQFTKSLPGTNSAQAQFVLPIGVSWGKELFFYMDSDRDVTIYVEYVFGSPGEQDTDQTGWDLKANCALLWVPGMQLYENRTGVQNVNKFWDQLTGTPPSPIISPSAFTYSTSYASTTTVTVNFALLQSA